MFKPAPNRVLIERFKEEEKEGSLLVMAESYRKTTNKGKIANLGKETPEKPQIYKVGDIVMYPLNSTVVEIKDEKDYVVVNQFDIVGTF